MVEGKTRIGRCKVMVSTRAEDVLARVLLCNVEDFVAVMSSLPDGEGEAGMTVDRVADAVVIVLGIARLDNALQ